MRGSTDMSSLTCPHIVYPTCEDRPHLPPSPDAKTVYPACGIDHFRQFELACQRVYRMRGSTRRERVRPIRRSLPRMRDRPAEPVKAGCGHKFTRMRGDRPSPSFLVAAETVYRMRMTPSVVGYYVSRFPHARIDLNVIVRFISFPFTPHARSTLRSPKRSTSCSLPRMRIDLCPGTSSSPGFTGMRIDRDLY